MLRYRQFIDKATCYVLALGRFQNLQTIDLSLTGVEDR